MPPGALPPSPIVDPNQSRLYVSIGAIATPPPILRTRHQSARVAQAFDLAGITNTVGIFIRHRLGPTDKLDCPHALGIDTFSAEWAKSFRHVLLLPPPHSAPSRRSVAQGRLRLLTTDASHRIFESALERVRHSYKLALSCSAPPIRGGSRDVSTAVDLRFAKLNPRST